MQLGMNTEEMIPRTNFYYLENQVKAFITLVTDPRIRTRTRAKEKAVGTLLCRKLDELEKDCDKHISGNRVKLAHCKAAIARLRISQHDYQNFMKDSNESAPITL